MSNDKLTGKVDKVKGNVKEQWGKTTKNQSLEQEGKNDQLKGKVKIGIGKIKETINKISKKTKHK
ncbi:CsbD family protein [Bacillaceae bacterium IKA-2]|nr:CsbD family protein [Bacillaceae bacterium IKA-2]